MVNTQGIGIYLWVFFEFLLYPYFCIFQRASTWMALYIAYRNCADVLLRICSLTPVHPLLKNAPYLVIGRVEVWLFELGHSNGGMKSGYSRLSRLSLLTVFFVRAYTSADGILLEDEVIPYSDYEQKFLHEENFAVLTAFSHQHRWNELRCQQSGLVQCPFGHRRDVIIQAECLTISIF